MQKINLQLTTEQAIIMHEIANQIMLSLTLNRSKTEFKLVEPLPLAFELSHYVKLEETEKNLRNVLENVQGMASEDSKIEVVPMQKRVQSGAKNRSRKLKKVN